MQAICIDLLNILTIEDGFEIGAFTAQIHLSVPIFLHLALTKSAIHEPA